MQSILRCLIVEGHMSWGVWLWRVTWAEVSDCGGSHEWQWRLLSPYFHPGPWHYLFSKLSLSGEPVLLTMTSKTQGALNRHADDVQTPTLQGSSPPCVMVAPNCPWYTVILVKSSYDLIVFADINLNVISLLLIYPASVHSLAMVWFECQHL